jgi:hypothetical protein
MTARAEKARAVSSTTTPGDSPSTAPTPVDPDVTSIAASDRASRLVDTAGDPGEHLAHAAEPVTRPTARRRPRRSTVVLGAALAVWIVAAGVGFLWLSSQLSESRSQIDDQRDQIEQQQREIEEQRGLIERKEQFGAAMTELYSTIDPLVGLPYATLVPWTEIEAFAGRAWAHRWTGVALDRDIVDVEAFTAGLANRLAAAREQAGTNASGSAWEAALDSLGGGWVTMGFDETNKPCGLDAMACVSGSSPFHVHVSADTRSDAQMTDWIRTGVAYHEYAHVLQFTNPEATASALTAFSGDMESMADCYALTSLAGWSLDHEVPIDDFSYWKVSVGYGYTCDDAQRQVIRDWVGGLGVQKRPVGA